ncbi:MAG: hypothetical protein PVH19_14375, partial [Planctomycetia bacterium]
MRRFGSLLAIVASTTLLLGSFFYAGSFAEAKPASTSEALRLKADKFKNQGNFKEAYDLYQKLALDKDTERETFTATDAKNATRCLQRLNRVSEYDAFLEKVVKTHADNPVILKEVADLYYDAPHYGFLVAGKFYRGHHRGSGRWINCQERDRVRALQLMSDAMPLLNGYTNAKGFDSFSKHFHYDFAKMLLGFRQYRTAWRLQYLTDLNTLPDWGDQDFYGSSSGAPVTDDGDPIYYTAPESFEKAANDGQRWRWCLDKSGDYPQTQLALADFLQNQFGVQTMIQHFGPFRQNLEKVITDEHGPFAVHTLKDNETIAKLANGVKRFSMPEEFQYIELYRKVANDESVKPDVRYRAMANLFDIYQNRRQYPKAAEYAKKLVEYYQMMYDEFKTRNYENQLKRWKEQLDQIVGRWGRIDSHRPFAAGNTAKLEYVFRNGAQVKFSACAIDMEQLLTDMKNGIKQASRSELSNEERREIEHLVNGLHRLPQILGNPKDTYHEKYKKYVNKEAAAQWSLLLKPPKDHFNSRVTVNIPTLAPGFYL